jgi:hypothetical protein
MSTTAFREYDPDSLAVRPLAELPMLRLADPARDVRGWEVQDHDRRRLGIVADLLVDIDRLRADNLLVSAAGDQAGTMVVVPLDGLTREHGGHRRLVPGDGLPAIALRYESTTRYVIWVAIALAIIALALWLLGSFR